MENTSIKPFTSNRVPDLLLTVAVGFSVFIVSGTLLWILSDLVVHGVGHLSWNFLTEPSANSGRSGGIAPILVSTFFILLICMSVSIPLGLGTAVYLAEFSSSTNVFGRVIRRSLDVLAGVPSIVFGLFGNAVFCVFFGLGFSILSGGLTLACMVLPLLIRSIEEGFRSISDDHRLASAALGMTRTKTVMHLLLPLAAPGILVGLVLGIGRAMAETAALIFTSGYVDRMPSSWMDSGRALSVHIYDLSMNVAGGEPNAYAAALVLAISLLVINQLALWIGSCWLKKIF